MSLFSMFSHDELLQNRIFIIAVSFFSFTLQEISDKRFYNKITGNQLPVHYLRNPGRDSSFPIFTRKEVETKRIGKEIKTINMSFKRLIILPFQYLAE